MPVSARDPWQLGNRQLESRIGETVRNVDHHARRARPVQPRYGVPIDLAGPGLRGIGGDARQSVSLLPVDLGGDQGPRHSGGVSRAGGRGDEGLRDEIDERRWRVRRAGHRPLARNAARTLSTVTSLMRRFDSTVMPAMCGVRITLGSPAKSDAVSAVIGSVSNTSIAAPPKMAGPQGSGERAFLDDATPRGIDQNRSGPHGRDLAGADQPPRLRRQRAMQRDDVGPRKDAAQIDALRIAPGRIAFRQEGIEASVLQPSARALAAVT